MPIDSGNLALKGLDDLFSTEEKRQEEQREQVQQIPIDALHPFTNHPFKVLDDEAMTRTVESIAQYGVLAPLIARPRPDGDGYEIISGHRRQYAAQLAGLETLPVIVRQMDDDAAVLLMVDSNLQRENILPSERAFAYKMKLEAIERTVGRPKNVGQVVPHYFGKRSTEVVAEGTGESYKQIQRFIRLTNLIPELLDMVDEKKIAFNPAVELSYLDESQQRDFLEAMEDTQNAPSFSQAQQLKKMAQQGEFSYEKAFDVMGQEKKSEKDTVTIKNETLRKYFPRSYTPKQMEEKIIQLLDSANPTDNDFTPFLNIMNEWYAKDTSNKIRAVFKSRMQDGKRCSGSIPYGYKRVPGDKQTLHIDAEAAAVVRRIFDMAASGASLAQIGQTLSDEKVLIPSAYEERHHPEAARNHSYHDPYRWNTTTLTYILDRQEYLGHTVLCKSIRENFKLKKRRAATPEERIIFKNTHEAIIDQETWDQAQRLRKRNPKKLPSGTYSHRLAGMVFCADCGSRMSFSSPESKHRDSDVVYDSDSSWQCSKYRNMYVSCTSHFIKTSTIEAAILNAIKAMTKEIIENEDEFVEQLQAAWENQNTQVSSESKKELHSVQKRIDELDALIRSLYENSVLGKIPERQYQRLMAQYDEEQAVCEARIAELKKELDVVETTKVDLKRFIKLIRKYKDCETLTDEMLYELVEKVVIHSASGGRTIYRQQQIDIYFNFIGDTFPSQIEISRGDKKNLTEQQLAKRKKYQKTAGENRKKKRAALREAAKTDPQSAAEYEALLQKGRERCRKYAQNKKLAQQEPADTVTIQFEPSFETPEEMKGESA